MAVCVEKMCRASFGLPPHGFLGSAEAMVLPTTGTSALLELLSPFVPDEDICAALPRHRGRGRRAEWSAAQLLRTTLLLLLTPVRSTNLLCELLPEQRTWRRFAHLPHRRRLPNVRQLHEFRSQLTPRVLRELNAGLLRKLLMHWPADQPGIGLIDATDLPAACNEYKKTRRLTVRRRRGARWADAQDRSIALVHRV
jgi:hypothetical protein